MSDSSSAKGANADIDPVAVTNRDFMSTRPIRSGVRGYCRFERRGQGGDIARAVGSKLGPPSGRQDDTSG